MTEIFRGAGRPPPLIPLSLGRSLGNSLVLHTRIRTTHRLETHGICVLARDR